MCLVPISIGRRLSMPSTGSAREMESVIGTGWMRRGRGSRGSLQAALPFGVAVRAQRCDGARGTLVGEDFGDQLAGDRAEAHAQHRVARRRRKVRETAEATDVRKAVGRARS